MATDEQANLVRMLRARDNVIRRAHKWKESVPLTLEGRAADEIDRLEAENRTLRNVGISQMEQINRLLAQQTNS